MIAPMRYPLTMRASLITLTRGSGFLAARAAAGVDARDRRFVANSLRELDRFLNLLIEAAAGQVMDGGFDHRAFARQTNAANKLRRLHAALGLPSTHYERLRAIGRVRESLFHRRGAEAARMDDIILAAAMPSPDDARADPTAADLARICRFYAETGAALVAACEAFTPPAARR